MINNIIDILYPAAIVINFIASMCYVLKGGRDNLLTGIYFLLLTCCLAIMWM